MDQDQRRFYQQLIDKTYSVDNKDLEDYEEDYIEILKKISQEILDNDFAPSHDFDSIHYNGERLEIATCEIGLFPIKTILELDPEEICIGTPYGRIHDTHAGGLLYIPKELGELTNLRRLEIYRFTPKFEDINVLKDLEELFINDEDIHSMPDLMTMQNLKRLDLSYCNITNLDFLKGDFPLLRWIELRKTNMTSLSIPGRSMEELEKNLKKKHEVYEGDDMARYHDVQMNADQVQSLIDMEKEAGRKMLLYHPFYHSNNYFRLTSGNIIELYLDGMGEEIAGLKGIQILPESVYDLKHLKKLANGYGTKINMERMGELSSLETWATGTQIPRSILQTNLKELQIYTNSLTEESRDVIAELEKRGCQYRIEPPSEAPR